MRFEVKLPRTLDVTIGNSFGDAYIASMTGPVTVNMSYGALTADRLMGDNTAINMSFGGAEIDALGNAEVNTSYGSFEVDHAGSWVINSSFSAIDIDEAESLNIKSSYDGFEIDQVGSLEVKGSFSSLEIDRVTRKLKAHVEYGGIEVDEIAADFTSVEVEAGFGGVELRLDDDASYTLDARVEMGGLEGPDGIDKKIVISDDGMTHKLNGVVGKNPGSRTVTVRAGQGGVEID